MLIAEFHKLMRLKAAWISMYIMIGIELFMIVSMGYSTQSPPEAQSIPAEESRATIALTTFPLSIPPTLSFIASFGPLLALVIASRLVGDEYMSGTAKQLISMGLDRRRYILTKIGGVIVASLFLLTGSLLGGSMISITLTLISREPLAPNMLTTAFLGKAIFSIGVAWFSLGFYSVFALFLTIITRSTASAIATGFLAFFLEGSLTGFLAGKFSIITRIAPYTISQNMDQIIPLIDQTECVYDIFTPKVARSLLILAVWLIAFVIGSMEVFQRQELH